MGKDRQPGIITLNKIFIVGAPRSGTTWLQLLLAQHPAIATCQETHFFSGYVRSWFRQWEREQNSKQERSLGLSSILSENEFIEMCRASSDYLFERILEDKSGACWVLEKTPVHVHHVDIIKKIYPDAYFIHMVRDPRSVVASLKAASRRWGKTWKNMNIVDYAELWVEAVTQGEQLVANNANAICVRYEDLRSDPVEDLFNLYNWLGIETERTSCEVAVDNCDLKRLKKPEQQTASTHRPWSIEAEPTDFFRQGDTESWKVELSAADVLVIESIGAEMMAHHSYSEMKTRAPVRRIFSPIVLLNRFLKKSKLTRPF